MSANTGDWHAVHRFDSLDSTNTWLKQHESPHKTVCIAEQQTGGRGRHGNVWFSPPVSNIYLSCKWCFEPELSSPGLLSLWVGLAVADVLSDFGLKGHGVKWPNDIYWQRLKLGGILIEGSQPHTGWIIGIGLNVNMAQEGAADISQPWTSLSQAMDKTVDKEALLERLLLVLCTRLEQLPGLGFDKLSARWDGYNILQGKTVSFNKNNKKMSGVVTGINQRGELCLTLPSGEAKAFNASISGVRW